MGLFNWKKSKPKSDAQIIWLEKVDSAYQRAFQVGNVTGLNDYLTRSCLSILMEKVRLGEKVYSGLDRYKHVKWTKGEVNENSVQWIKEVTYDNIRMSHGVVVPVGDECRELWTIIKQDGRDLVSSIGRVL